MRFLINLMILALLIVLITVGAYKLDETTPLLTRVRERVPALTGPIDFTTGAGYVILTRTSGWLVGKNASPQATPYSVWEYKTHHFVQTHPAIHQGTNFLGQAGHMLMQGLSALGTWLSGMFDWGAHGFHKSLPTRELGHKTYYFVPNSPDSLPIIRPEGMYIPIPSDKKPEVQQKPVSRGAHL